MRVNNQTLHPTTINNCYYVSTKIKNMIYDFYHHDEVCALIANVDEAENAEKLCEILDRVVCTQRAMDNIEWDAVKKAKILASEFRIMKSFR